MKTEKTINLTAYVVEYIDQREPKPRTIHSQTVVLDGGKVSALARLDMRPAGWITQQFERDGYTVASIHKGETITAHVDLADLWRQTSQAVELARLQKTVVEMQQKAADMDRAAETLVSAGEGGDAV